jgi:hypothetical protein
MVKQNINALAPKQHIWDAIYNNPKQNNALAPKQNIWDAIYNNPKRNINDVYNAVPKQNSNDVYNALVPKQNSNDVYHTPDMNEFPKENLVHRSPPYFDLRNISATQYNTGKLF